MDYCNLPVGITTKIKELPTTLNNPIYLEIIWKSGHFLYLLWAGGISKVDALEVTSSTLQMAANRNLDSQHKTAFPHNGETVTVTVLPQVSQAIDVYLKPTTSVYLTYYIGSKLNTILYIV